MVVYYFQVWQIGLHLSVIILYYIILYYIILYYIILYYIILYYIILYYIILYYIILYYIILFIEAVTIRDHAGWNGARIIIECWIGKNEGNFAVA